MKKATTKNFATVCRPTLLDFKKGWRGQNRLQYRLQGWIEDYLEERWPDVNRWVVIDDCMERLRGWLPRFADYRLVSGDKKLFKSLVTALTNDAAKDYLGIRHKPFSFAKFKLEHYTEVREDLVEKDADDE